MLKSNFITAEDAANMITDGSTLCTIAMTLVSASESILKRIEQRFLTTTHPANITLLHSCGQSDRSRGIQHLAHEGLVKRIIGSHWGLQPRWMEMIANSQVEAFCLPQGQIAQLYQSMACGLPGKMSKVGLGTFIDPRLEGGKMNDRTKPLSNLIDIIHYQDEEYLFYKSIPLDFVIIRGTTCDEMGNLTTTEEAMKLEVLPAVLAAKKYGGKVIAQVKQVAKNGTLNPKDVVVPGVFIDAIVVCDNPQEDHRQTSSWFYDPSYCGQLNVPSTQISFTPLDIRKLIARRATQEIRLGNVINIGTGIPNDMVGKICYEEGISDDVMITVESGIYGGIQAGGIDFGIGQNLVAMISHQEQMDYYNGAGGFIDITQNAKKVVFCGTFTTKDTHYQLDNDKLTIIQEGKVKKMVERVTQISFNGKLAREKGQPVFIVTERCVFRLIKQGVELIEVAPGIDVEKDILSLMGFVPHISSDLKLMDVSLFNQDKSFGLKQFLKMHEESL